MTIKLFRRGKSPTPWSAVLEILSKKGMNPIEFRGAFFVGSTNEDNLRKLLPWDWHAKRINKRGKDGYLIYHNPMQ